MGFYGFFRKTGKQNQKINTRSSKVFKYLKTPDEKFKADGSAALWHACSGSVACYHKITKSSTGSNSQGQNEMNSVMIYCIVTHVNCKK